MKKIYVFLIVILISISVLSAPFSAFAAKQPENSQPIRVGYIDYAGFIEKDGNKYTGYGVEYLNRISEYTGWEYEYVYGHWEFIMEELKQGRLDFICSAQYTPEREQDYEFSAYPIGYTQGVIYTSATNDRLFFNDYEALNNSTIGLLSGSAINALLEQYAVLHNFEYKSIEYPNAAELSSALSKNSVNAIATESLSYQDDLKLVANIGADAFYIISYKNSPFMTELNTALSKIKTDVYFEANLYDKFFGSSTVASDLQLTRDEFDYLQTVDTVKIAVYEDRFPLSYTDDGKLRGIYISVMEQIASKVGLDFEYIPVPQNTTISDYLKSGNAELFVGINQSLVSNISTELTVSSGFMSDNIGIVGRSGFSFDEQETYTVAIPSLYAETKEGIKSYTPNVNFQTYDTIEECLRAVRDESADFVLEDSYVSAAALQSPRFEMLSVFDAYSIEQSACIAALTGKHELLMSILDKCIAKSDSTSLANTITEYTIKIPYKATVQDLIYEYKVPIIIVIILIIFLFILLTVLAVTRQRHLKVVEKTNILLKDAIEQANAANKSKSLFLSRMSHEIRTPMNAIIGLTSIAKSENTNSEKVDECLSRISSSSDLLLSILNDILDMSAIESRKMRIAHENFNLRELLASVSGLFYPQCLQKNHDFKIKLSGNINENLVGDSLRVSQILNNLISNAIKFTHNNGKITVSIKQTPISGDRIYVYFIVKDNGCGMSEELKKRVFEPFEQENASTAQLHGGSGLGLSITKNLIDLMHGSIEIESEKNVGTKITVVIPFDLSENNKEIPNNELKNHRAMIIDSDEETLAYLDNLFDTLAIEHSCSLSGKEAISRMIQADRQNSPYSVCFVDTKLSDMDSAAVTTAIRKHFGNRTVVVVISSYYLPSTEKEAIDSGADMFLPRPLFPSIIYKTLMQISNTYTEMPSDVKDFDISGGHVLIAEDIALNMDIAVKLLAMKGVTTDCAVNGKEAFERFSNSAPGTYDAILLDIHMPVMNGFEATRAIRTCNHPEAVNIPIYAMTADVFDEDISACLAAGMNGHISKPINTNELYNAIEKAMKKT